MSTQRQFNSLEEWEKDIIYAEQVGVDDVHCGEGYHYTLGGVRVSEPSANWGRDYLSLEEAISYMCTPLKPSKQGVSGMTQKAVNELLNEFRSMWEK